MRVILWLTLLVYIYDTHDFFFQMFREGLVVLGFTVARLSKHLLHGDSCECIVE